MKKIDKLKHEVYLISMKIISIESKQSRGKLSKNECSELTILKEKLEKLNKRIEDIKNHINSNKKINLKNGYKN